MTEIRDSYKKRYRMRALGEGGLNIVVSIPRMVIEREAGKRWLTIGEFLERFRAIAQFDNFDGIVYTFEETKEKEVPAKAEGSDTDGR